MYFFIQYSTFIRLSSPVPLGGGPGAGRTMGVAAGWFFPLVTAGQVILNVHTLIELGCREDGLMRSTLSLYALTSAAGRRDRAPLAGKVTAVQVLFIMEKRGGNQTYTKHTLYLDV